jgi:hypothetical protein
VKIGKSANETLALLTVAYGEYAVKKLSVIEWHRRLKKGREDVQDDPRSDPLIHYEFIAQGQTVKKTVLFGSTDKVMGICLEETTQTLA